MTENDRRRRKQHKWENEKEQNEQGKAQNEQGKDTKKTEVNIQKRPK